MKTLSTARPRRLGRQLIWYLASAGSLLALPAVAAQPEILVLSNRADLVSGGNALVEIKWPAGTNLAMAKVALDGVNVRDSFVRRPDGRYMGLVSGLRIGRNVLTARVPGGGAQIEIDNHPLGGPVFSGPQVQPWICARLTATSVLVTDPATGNSANATTRVSGLGSDPVDEQCNAAPRYTYYYQPKAREGTDCAFTNTGANRCFEPFPVIDDPASRPPDGEIADFTNDRGDTAKAILRVERGAMNRGIYELVTPFDPAQSSSAIAPQTGWNGKLLWSFGGGSGASRFQSPPAVSAWNTNELQRGYMSAVSSLTDHGTHANPVTAAEMMIMLKEHIVETYGEIRFTVGYGCSGGSIMQHMIASMYPGVLNGLQPGCSYPDTLSTRTEVHDCGLLQNRYYNTANGSALSNAQRAAINGHLTTAYCNAWITSFLGGASPSTASNCGSGFPAALVYHPTLRPQGIRCNILDALMDVIGSYIDTDGVRKPYSPHGNVGVQWGLKALQDGVITPEDFVRLNEGVGSYTADFDWNPNARSVPDPQALEFMYRSGYAVDGRQLASVPVITLRGNQSAADIHMNWRAWQMRERMVLDHGNSDNLVIWAFTGGGAAAPGAALRRKAVETMDAWLTAIEQDTSGDPLPVKVVRAKPAAAQDFCLASNGGTDAQVKAMLELEAEACPVKYQASPRQVAGGSIAEAAFQCSLKPLHFTDADYKGIQFTQEQQQRLHRAFSSGVCDWTRPAVSQRPASPWNSYAGGPGGQPLGAPPVSHPIR